MTRAYEEIIDYIVGRAPDAFAEFQPSEESLQRIRHLLDRLKAGTILPDESNELDDYVELDNKMSLAKARARKQLAHE